MNEYMKNLPSAKDVEDLLNRHDFILIDKADETEAVEESIYAFGAEQNCTRYTGYYLPSTINSMGKELAVAAKEDAQLKQLIENLAAFMLRKKTFLIFLLQPLNPPAVMKFPLMRKAS